MPKVRRRSVPRALLEHLWVRIEEREIPITQLELLANWLEREPEVPVGKWFKRFPEMTVCGEGEFGKDFPADRTNRRRRGNHLIVSTDIV